MTRFSRLFLIGALLLVTLGRPTPAAAVSAGCSTLGADGRLLGAGRLFIQASYGTDPATVMRFYVQGPETRTVYEGHDPQSFGLYLSNLTPGTYKWMLHSTYAVGDGTFIEQTNTLATCTVSGLIDVPALKGKTAAEAADTLAAAALSLGTVSSAASSTVAVGEIIKQNPGRHYGEQWPGARRDAEADDGAGRHPCPFDRAGRRRPGGGCVPFSQPRPLGDSGGERCSRCRTGCEHREGDNRRSSVSR